MNDKALLALIDVNKKIYHLSKLQEKHECCFACEIKGPNVYLR